MWRYPDTTAAKDHSNCFSTMYCMFCNSSHSYNNTKISVLKLMFCPHLWMMSRSHFWIINQYVYISQWSIVNITGNTVCPEVLQCHSVCLITPFYNFGLFRTIRSYRQTHLQISICTVTMSKRDTALIFIMQQVHQGHFPD